MLRTPLFILALALLAPLVAFLPRRLLPSLVPRGFTTFTKTTDTTTTNAAAMSSATYAQELYIAQLAVQRAAILTKRVFHEKAKGTVDKND